jgi:sporulation protein YlmC with PRC-barrel domain
MRTLEDVETWRGMKVVDADGDKVGTVGEIYLDRQTGEPEWMAVRTGLFGTKLSFVPIEGAEVAGDRELRVPYQKEQIKNAPKVEADGELEPEEERKLYEHYGRSDYGEWQGDDRTTAMGLADERAGRFGRPGDAGPTPGAEADLPGAADEPRIVGVRLRRVIVIAEGPVDEEPVGPA